ncbi:MFS transporter [Chromatiales bacterium (ex Bugula neritina AB1)]|nr:MFS transporter [Chromatiales bacterium (ex Bugula neritina AB1)]
MNTLLFIRDNARWLLGGLILTIFSSFGQTYFIALFGSEIRETFSLSHGEFGTIYMVGTLASAATLVWIGRVVDFYAVSTVAFYVCLALSLACLGMSMVSSVWMLVIVIFGLRLFGQGMMSHIAMVAMGRWYSAERGRAVSITSMGFQIGSGVLPLVMVSVVALIGWRASWVLAAAIMIFIATPAIYLLMKKERIPRGQLPATESNSHIKQWTQGEVLADPLFWVMITGVLAPAFIGTAVFFHQTHISEIKGWSRELIAGSIALAAITTILFSLLSGLLIDRFSARQLLPTFLIPLGLGNLVLGLADSPLAIVIYMLLHGVSNGISNTLFGALWPEVYGTLHLGAVRSLIMAAMVIASAMGPGATGWLIDVGIGFELQLVWMGVYCLVTAILMYPVTRALSHRQ